MPFAIIRPIVWVLLHIAYALLGGIRFEGRENVPKQGGVLITPNHISDADPPTMGLAVPRDCYFMAKEELFNVPILSALIRWLHGFPVKRYTADRVALRRAEELLKQGEALVIFPEGKVSEDAKLQPILPGVLLLAQRTNVPIVPTIIEGTDKLIPYGKYIPRPAHRRSIVRFGPPVMLADLTGQAKGGEALKRGAERLQTLLRALQEGRPYPPLNAEETHEKPLAPTPAAERLPHEVETAAH